MEILERLRVVELFGALRDDEEALKQLRDVVSVREYQRGQFIVEEGDVGGEMFILLEGQATVTKRTLHDDQYVVTELSGDEQHTAFFGEIALVDPDVRSASVRAESDCKVVVLSRESFHKLGARNPRLGFAVGLEIGRRIASQLRRANRDMMILFEALLSEVAGE